MLTEYIRKPLKFRPDNAQAILFCVGFHLKRMLIGCSAHKGGIMLGFAKPGLPTAVRL